VRGPHGGYLLAREKRRVTLADVYRAVGEDDEIPSSTPLGNKIISPIIKDLQEKIVKQMEEVSINDLYQQASSKSVRKAADEKNDFAI